MVNFYVIVIWILASSIVVVMYAPGVKKWYFFDRHVNRANQLLRQGAVYQALLLHHQVGNYQGIQQYLASQLSLPKHYPDNLLSKIISLLTSDKLRPLITNTYKELAEIKATASDRNNHYIPENFKSDLSQATDFAVEALFHICDCLAAVARQNIDLKLIKNEIQQEQEKLQQIAKIAQEAKQELGKLTFSHNRNDVSINFSNSYFKQFIETAKVLRQQNQFVSNKIKAIAS